jgi:hypothetical protein
LTPSDAEDAEPRQGERHREHDDRAHHPQHLRDAGVLAALLVRRGLGDQRPRRRHVGANGQAGEDVAGHEHPRLLREDDPQQAEGVDEQVPLIDPLAAELVAHQVDVIAAGGTLRKLTRSLVGPEAVRGIEAHFADQVLFSVRGITPDGHLTDPDALEAEVKRAMVKRAARAVLLADGSKFERAALTRIADVSDVELLIAADVPEQALARLEQAGVAVVRA